MASSGTFIFILAAIWITAGNAKNPFVEVECKAENVGEHGHQSLLECVVTTKKEVTNAVIRVVTWSKEGVEDPLLVFNKGNLQTKTGYRFAEPSWNENNMNTSLLITKTAVADDGDYTCMVITDSGDHNSNTRLQVKATYSTPTIHSIPEEIKQNADSELICEADGGYPKGQLRWFDEHKTDWTKSAKMNAMPTDNGLFKLSSKLPLMRGSTFSKYTCMVFNASGVKESSATFEPSPTSAGHEDREGRVNSSKIVAPVVVIGSLIVGLLLALLIYRRRSQKARRPSATPLMGGQQRCNAAERDVEDCCCETLDPENNQFSQP